MAVQTELHMHALQGKLDLTKTENSYTPKGMRKTGKPQEEYIFIKLRFHNELVSRIHKECGQLRSKGKGSKWGTWTFQQKEMQEKPAST